MTGVIEVEHLFKRYGNRCVVNGVSFSVGRGEVVGILGPNGAGKTTTVECVAGLRRPDGGRISVLGFDPQRNRSAVRERVGAQLQESRLPNKIRVREALDLHSSFYEHPMPWRVLVEQVGLGAELNTYFADLSGGQKQRLSVALALVGDPEIAILDELTTGLDPQARRDVWGLVESIRDRGVTILLVTHFMEEAERLCDRVILFDRGKVVAAGTPSGVVAQTHPQTRIRFRPSGPVDGLSELPEVEKVWREGAFTVVTGRASVTQAVTSLLARLEVVAEDMRVESATLDDAFLELTLRPLDPDGPWNAKGREES